MPGLFEKRHRTGEIDQLVKFKRGMIEVRDFVQKCQEVEKRYWDLGKRALRLGDRAQFESIAKAYLRAQETENRWRRYLVAMETVLIERDQVKATAAFTKSMNDLSTSIMAGARAEDITRVQYELEKALERARSLDETLATVMNATSEAIFSARGLAEESIGDIAKATKDESDVASPAVSEDDPTSAGLRRIEQEMRKEMG